MNVADLKAAMFYPVAVWKRIPFALAAVFVALTQTVILAAMIEDRASVLRTGTDIILRASPIDPRDLFRGEYVTLGYDISTIQSDLIQSDDVTLKEVRKKAWPLHVRLKPQPDGFWTAVEASFRPLARQDGSVVIVSKPDPSLWAYFSGSKTVHVSYGIERYYVPEGDGPEIETERDSQRISVAVRVAVDGRAQIRALLLDGVPLYEEPLY